MEYFLALVAVIIVICILLNNASTKMGVPVLLAFILLGIVFGNNGIHPMEFNDYEFAEKFCTFALIFIMFYGGFGTSWKAAKSVATEAGLLASAGVLLTAALTGVFCHFALRWGWLESLLLGSVISSTDAASVFSILRSRKLGLKNNTAPLLEVESGSNDPCSNILTLVMLSIIQGSAKTGAVVWMVFSQFVFGAIFGLVIATLALFAMRRISFKTSGLDSMFIVAIALFSYAIPSLVGGNGYLSAYIVGIVLGNNDFSGRKNLVAFFDGITSLMQVFIFFILGLLAKLNMMAKVILPAVLIFLALLFIVRPIVIGSILTPFRKYKFKQQALISFVGLRGASSIVFAVVATVGATTLQHDILSTVFCIVLLSIGLQGSLLPHVAQKLDMIDTGDDVMKTFTDFAEETDMHFSEILIIPESPWVGKKVMDIGVPKNILFCSLVHKDGTSVVPNGHTVLNEGDRVIMCSKAVHGKTNMNLVRRTILPNSKWIGTSIKDYPAGKNQIVLIKRGDENIIPHGGTFIQANDVLFINKGTSKS